MSSTCASHWFMLSEYAILGLFLKASWNEIKNINIVPTDRNISQLFADEVEYGLA